MKELEIHETDNTLAWLLNEVTASSGVIITRNGKPVARIVPFGTTSPSKGNYPLRGMPISISEDFDEPMPELWSALGE